MAGLNHQESTTWGAGAPAVAVARVLRFTTSCACSPGWIPDFAFSDRVRTSLLASPCARLLRARGTSETLSRPPFCPSPLKVA